MKRLTQIAGGALLAGSVLMSTSTLAEGGVSYNVGFTSEYYYRGILQKDSSASAGIDYENGGFYAGAWTADVGDGVEVDGYFGYGMETDSGFSASLGFTGYYYTGEFDDTYEEINFNLGYKIVSLEYSAGEWDGFGAEEDYDFLAVTVESANGFYATYGTFGDDFDGDYFEVGYDASIADFDVGVSAIFSSDELSDQVDSDGDATESEAVVFTIGKTF
jgi:uncharacterized protein (TIGR02001 family)